MANHVKAVDGIRVCSTCKLPKDEDDFRLRSGKDSRWRESRCRECTNKAYRMLRAERWAWLESIKLDSGCVDCGYNEYSVGLDFDHLPQFKKSFNISERLTTASIKSILEEIEKCEVVCATCHRVRTWKRSHAITDGE